MGFENGHERLIRRPLERLQSRLTNSDTQQLDETITKSLKIIPFVHKYVIQTLLILIYLLHKKQLNSFTLAQDKKAMNCYFSTEWQQFRKNTQKQRKPLYISTLFPPTCTSCLTSWQPRLHLSYSQHAQGVEYRLSVASPVLRRVPLPYVRERNITCITRIPCLNLCTNALLDTKKKHFQLPSIMWKRGPSPIWAGRL